MKNKEGTVNIYDDIWIKTGEIPKDFKTFKLKNFKFQLILISFLVLAAGLFFISSQNVKKEIVSTKGNEEKNAEKEDVLIRLKNGYVKKSDQNEGYNVYIDEVFNFFCIIPKDYTVNESGDSVNRMVLKNKDSNILIFVGASENKFGLTIKELMEQYISTMGKADYKASGESWYAVSKYHDGVSYYKKTFIKEGKILWFEFNIKDGAAKTKDEKQNLEKMIEFMEDNFNIIK